MSSFRTSAYCELSNKVVLNFPRDRRRHLASITLAFRDEEGMKWNEELLMNNIPIYAWEHNDATGAQQEQTKFPRDIPTYERDSSYYFSFLTVEVEDTLYSIPAHHISPLLGDAGSSILVSSDESPIVLKHARKSDFLALLKLLHPLSPDLTPSTLTSNEWISVLKFATENSHRRDVNVARTMAINYLAFSKITLFERIELGQKYFVHDWVKPNIKLLVQNEEPITRDMVDRIGYKTVEGICRLREQSYRATLGNPERGFFKNGPRGSVEESSIVERIFEKDLNAQAQKPFLNDNDQIVRRILLAYNSGEQMWLQLALEEMVSCNDVLTAEQAAKLPYADLAVKVWQARLDLKKPSSPRFNRTPMVFNEQAFEKEFPSEAPRSSAFAATPSASTAFTNVGASFSANGPSSESTKPPPLSSAFALFPNVGPSSHGPTPEPSRNFAFTLASPFSTSGPTPEATKSSAFAPQPPAFPYLASPSFSRPAAEPKTPSSFVSSPFGATSPVEAPSSAFGSSGKVPGPFGSGWSSFGSGGQASAGTYVYGSQPPAGQASSSFGKHPFGVSPGSRALFACESPWGSSAQAEVSSLLHHPNHHPRNQF